MRYTLRPRRTPRPDAEPPRPQLHPRPRPLRPPPPPAHPFQPPRPRRRPTPPPRLLTGLKCDAQSQHRPSFGGGTLSRRDPARAGRPRPPAARPHKREARRTGPAQLQPWPARRAGARANFRKPPAQPGREAVSKMVNRPFPPVSQGALTPGKAPRRWSGVPADCFLRPLRVGRRAVTASTDSACGLMAGTTGLEPATSDVTGRRSNQLNYVPALGGPNGCEWWAITDSNRGPSACKADALTN